MSDDASAVFTAPTPPKEPYELPGKMAHVAYLGTYDGRHAWGLPWGFAFWHSDGEPVPTRWYFIPLLNPSDPLRTLWQARFLSGLSPVEGESREYVVQTDLSMEVSGTTTIHATSIADAEARLSACHPGVFLAAGGGFLEDATYDQSISTEVVSIR